MKDRGEATLQAGLPEVRKWGMQSLKGLWLTLALYKASLPHHEVPAMPSRSSDSLVWYGKATKGFNASGHSGGETQLVTWDQKSQLIQEEPRERDKEGKQESGRWGSSHWEPRQWLRPPELREHLDA